MAKRRYASGTSVAVSKSRGQIDKLLREWGATGVQWTDQWEAGRVAVRFCWIREEDEYMARLDIKLPTREDLEAREDMTNQRTGRVSEARVRDELARIGTQEHRVLLLWLKAAFNAIEIGMVAAEQIFLPFFEGKDGKTVWEAAEPRLSTLRSTNAAGLLPAH